MIHYFNPGHETAVHNASSYYMAPANVIAMQQELAFLPAWYANNNDAILVYKHDNNNYKYLYEHFITLPKAITVNQLLQYKDDKVRMWGISPQAIQYFTSLNDKYEISLQIPKWNNRYTYLNSRLFAKDCLTRLVNDLHDISGSLIPDFYTDLDAVEKNVNKSSFQLLAKAPYSSSGRGLLWLPTDVLTRTERQIIHGILKKQGSVSLEKVIDKQVDFAMEFLSDGDGNVSFEGYSLFNTNAKGGYQSNYIGNQLNIEKELSEKIPLHLLDIVKEKLITLLAHDAGNFYQGCIGVDMMLYKENDEYKLNPCLEINMRYNMGYLSLKLYEDYLSPTAEGKFFLDFSSKAGEIYKKHLQYQEQYPSQYENNRFVKGYLPLCPVNNNNRYWAYVLVN